MGTWERRWRLARDIILFTGGLAIAAHEVLAAGSPSPELLLLAGAMMGLPVALQKDGK